MLLSTLEFGSLLTYVPQPVNDERKKAKDFVVYVLKNDKVMVGQPALQTTTNVAKYIANNISSLPFGNFFGADVTLVPVPSSTLKKPGDLWVPYNLAKALEAENLGQVMVGVERKIALPKAATAKPEERPTPKQHYESLEIKNMPQGVKKIVLVDDVVTRGSTAIGVASKLREIYPLASIKVFAAVRTISSPKEFVEFIQPCTGKIIVENNQAYRRP